MVLLSSELIESRRREEEEEECGDDDDDEEDLKLQTHAGTAGSIQGSERMEVRWRDRGTDI